MAPPKPSLIPLGKVAIVTAVATIGMAVATFVKHQSEMRSSIWLKEIKQKLGIHPGVKFLFGDNPVALGTITRREPDFEAPSVPVDPPATHLLTMRVTGNKSKGMLYAWLNNPDEKKIESVDDWNVARIELQVGNNKEKKMPIP